MQMRQQNGWLLVLSLSQESWLHVWLVALWYICVPLCCFMWLCLRQHSKAIQLPVNWPVLWGSVSKIQMYNSVSVCSRVALRPDTTNHSPDVPTPHNSPVWNSTNPISAAVVSTVGPHSWACHRPQIRPLWLLCCIPVITPKICWSQQTALTPPHPLDLWLLYCIPMPLKVEVVSKSPPTFRSMTIGLPHTAYFTLQLKKVGSVCDLTKKMLKKHGRAFWVFMAN